MDRLRELERLQRERQHAGRELNALAVRNNGLQHVFMSKMAQHEAAVAASNKVLENRTAKLTEQQQQCEGLDRRMMLKQQHLDNARNEHMQRLGKHVKQQQQQMGVLEQKNGFKWEHLEANRAILSPDLSLPTTNKISVQHSDARKQLLAERKAKLAAMGHHWVAEGN